MKGNLKSFTGGIMGCFICVLIFYFSVPLKNLEGDFNNYPVQSHVYETKGTDTVFIAAQELPPTVKQVIQTDSLINDLKITVVKKISQKNDDYYDVCFLDTDNFNIMVLYDKNGGVILQ